MRIIIVRHGETNENAAKRYLGHYDAELNQHGQQQLRSLSETLKRTETQPITAIYSSDLVRAVESAQIIGNEFQIQPIPVFALRELHFGDFDCKTYEEIRQKDPERLEKWILNPYMVAPPNGETLLQLGKRVDDWWETILTTEQPTGTIVIVSHGGPIRWFLSKWVKGDPREFWNVEGLGHGKAMMIEWNQQTRIFTLGKKLEE
ncbi:alpha-ribazole phosphatase/probable phosphoglycerate mutase [Neobacillus bataviensis]|uniref:Alpha-ribazole phosphatase/probable phosphoglycerate mutase n=1 Tax=Neobacillus bataviensis TaxID=220685 RepID=A0A561DXG7_9BACI|nr:histidine phosphatase family protein [Neobacillus bataviensis]TWE08061.1 alpha-ribazole phosphatase/probable phosphoglycerate mutase [Neobacillus bataviensis]